MIAGRQLKRSVEKERIPRRKSDPEGETVESNYLGVGAGTVHMVRVACSDGPHRHQQQDHRRRYSKDRHDCDSEALREKKQ